MGQQPNGERPAQLRLRIPAPTCEECRRAARSLLQGLKGVLLVDIARESGAITVTYDPSLIDPAGVHQASEQAGCVST